MAVKVLMKVLPILIKKPSNKSPSNFNLYSLPRLIPSFLFKGTEFKSTTWFISANAARANLNTSYFLLHDKPKKTVKNREGTLRVQRQRSQRFFFF